MTRSGPPSALPEQDYEAIEDAVMETARGRWFLNEYARRNRTADTEMLLQAIAKLQNAIGERAPEPNAPSFRKELLEMAEAILQTKREIAAMRPAGGDDGRIGEATLELDAVVESTEKATSEILYAAEQVQEIAWGARENGTPQAVCDAIDSHVTEIYTACSFQDVTGQRTQKVVKVLRFIENRINAMVSIWDGETLPEAPVHVEDDKRPDAHLLNGPQLAGMGKSQDEINTLLLDEIEFDEVVFAAEDDASGSAGPAQPDEIPSTHIQADVDETSAQTDEGGAIDFAAVCAADPDTDTETLSETGAAASAEPVASAADNTAGSADRDAQYDLEALEQAAENAVALPPSGHFDAYPHDDIAAPAAEPDDTDSLPAAAAQTGDPAPDAAALQPASDGPVVVPTLHELVFAPEAAQQEPAEPADAEAGDPALAAIASQIERSVGLHQPAKQSAIPQPGNDLETLTVNQRIILFS